MGKSRDALEDEDEDGWEGARVFVLTTTSGLAASMKLHEKQDIWRGLGEWVEKRRRERAGMKEAEEAEEAGESSWGTNGVEVTA